MSRRCISTIKGFSLLEAAIAVLILGVVLASLAGVFERYFHTMKIKEQRQDMTTIHDSLTTFLKSNRYLPCPDTDNDGHENRVADANRSVCDEKSGGLPYRDLGVKSVDAWDNPYYYQVHQRSTDATYINDICEPASVLGYSGSRSLGSLEMCPDTNLYYCNNKCNDGCTSACVTSPDPRFGAIEDSTVSGNATDLSGAPYFHLVTPPFGETKGDYNIELTDEAGVTMDDTVVAIVLSWGADGYEVNENNCSAGVENEENCDGDRYFIYTKTGENRDFIDWVTVNQAKMALISQRKLR